MNNNSTAVSLYRDGARWCYVSDDEDNIGRNLDVSSQATQKVALARLAELFPNAVIKRAPDASGSCHGQEERSIVAHVTVSPHQLGYTATASVEGMESTAIKRFERDAVISACEQLIYSLYMNRKPDAIIAVTRALLSWSD